MAHITPTLGLIGPYISAIQALDISYGRMTPWVMFHSRRVWPRGPAVRRGCWEIRVRESGCGVWAFVLRFGVKV